MEIEIGAKIKHFCCSLGHRRMSASLLNLYEKNTSFNENVNHLVQSVRKFTSLQVFFFPQIISFWEKYNLRWGRGGISDPDELHDNQGDTALHDFPEPVMREITVLQYYNIFYIHLLVHLYFLGFNPCILNIYSLISCSVFQFGSCWVFTV